MSSGVENCLHLSCTDSKVVSSENKSIFCDDYSSNHKGDTVQKGGPSWRK